MDKLPINCLFRKYWTADISPPLIMSEAADTQYISDISPINQDTFILGCTIYLFLILSSNSIKRKGKNKRTKVVSKSENT